MVRMGSDSYGSFLQFHVFHKGQFYDHYYFSVCEWLPNVPTTHHREALFDNTMRYTQGNTVMELHGFFQDDLNNITSWLITSCYTKEKRKMKLTAISTLMANFYYISTKYPTWKSFEVVICHGKLS